ncbi:MAG: hypothetical protein AABX75_01345 [Nanoarchaeota archaeon]
MINVFVFVKGASDKYSDVISGLEKLIKPKPECGVRIVYQNPLIGEYDSAMKLEGDDLTAISKYLSTIRSVAGVIDTKTVVCVPSEGMPGFVSDYNAQPELPAAA